jgi:hypothetical protein
MTAIRNRNASDSLRSGFLIARFLPRNQRM